MCLDQDPVWSLLTLVLVAKVVDGGSSHISRVVVGRG